MQTRPSVGELEHRKASSRGILDLLSISWDCEAQAKIDRARLQMGHLVPRYNAVEAVRQLVEAHEAAYGGLNQAVYFAVRQRTINSPTSAAAMRYGAALRKRDGAVGTRRNGMVPRESLRTLPAAGFRLAGTWV